MTKVKIQKIITVLTDHSVGSMKHGVFYKSAFIADEDEFIVDVQAKEIDSRRVKNAIRKFDKAGFDMELLDDSRLFEFRFKAKRRG